MSDPPRLSVTHRGGLTAAMLDSARDDDPPASARQRAIVAFGAGAGAVLTAGMAEGGAGVTATKVATWLAVAKWAGGGAVLAVFTAAAVSSVPPRASTVPLDPPPSVTAPAALPAPMPNAIAPTTPSTAVDPVPAVLGPSPELSVGTSPRTQGGPSRAVRIAPPSPVTETVTGSPAAPEPTLDAEVRWLDKTSALIRSGDTARGLQMLDEYKSRFPSAMMLPESQVLRIEALVRKGDKPEATRLAEAFLARSPQSALAARVRTLLLSMQKGEAQ